MTQKMEMEPTDDLGNELNRSQDGTGRTGIGHRGDFGELQIRSRPMTRTTPRARTLASGLEGVFQRRLAALLISHETADHSIDLQCPAVQGRSRDHAPKLDRRSQPNVQVAGDPAVGQERHPRSDAHVSVDHAVEASVLADDHGAEEFAFNPFH
jgi:hypothetical protein